MPGSQTASRRLEEPLAPYEPWFVRSDNGAKLIRYLDPANACGVEEEADDWPAWCRVVAALAVRVRRGVPFPRRDDPAV